MRGAACPTPDWRMSVSAMSAHTILVVDDSPLERGFLVELLGHSGYTVITADNGEEALDQARLRRPALVVLDVVMPGASGFQVVRALSRDPQTSEIPVILCTGKDTEVDRIWGLRQGARDYVTKPVHGETLLSKIAELVK